jgi:uncharacterized protein (TIGR03435 family)
MSIGPARVDIGFLSLGDMIPIACRVKPYQVAGPEWMKTDRWDILAKLPEGASKDQVPEMLQALLADRFKLRVHKETRVQRVLALVVDKPSPLLKEAGPPADAFPADAKGRELASTSQGQVRESADFRTLTLFGGSLGPVRVTMLGDEGREVRVELNVTMALLAEMLSSVAERPVVDMTGLVGRYQAPLEMPEGDQKAILRFGMGFGKMPEADGPSADRPGDSIFGALKKLGLKLEPRSAPLQMLVVDALEKTPTAN